MIARRHTHQHIATSRAGFTLLELLFSFMIIGIMAALITNALRLGFQAIDRGEHRIDALQRLRASVSFVSAQIQSHIPLTYEDNGEKRFYFSGTRDTLRLSSNYSIWGGEEGYVIVNYAVEPDATGKKVLAVTENIIGMEATRQTHLFNPVDAIYFEYFSKGPTDEKGTWVDDWKDPATVPEKVRLHVVTSGRDLATIIPVRVTASLKQPPTSPAENLWFDVKSGIQAQ